MNIIYNCILLYEYLILINSSVPIKLNLSYQSWKILKGRVLRLMESEDEL